MKRKKLIPVLAVIFAPMVCQRHAAAAESGASRPNVILILTDDQGYGEIAAHGNPIIKTPNMDKLRAASVRLTDFHVDPTCAPTRSALLTGRYSTRTGVWHTINGRSMMHPDELTLAEIFKASGYRTAMIGKWHLGDNYPCRPEDQGFDHVIRHQGGGIGNGPDYWQNDYFDDTFKVSICNILAPSTHVWNSVCGAGSAPVKVSICNILAPSTHVWKSVCGAGSARDTVNGKWQKFNGYCTDVWFREATKYVERNKDQPFFLYLSTNAPHGPYFVENKYAKPYEAAGLPTTMAKFYGMITNIDENVGRFRARLDELGLTENTLLIFLTDNGTTAGWIDSKSGYKYYNAGMRGWKGSQWEGGHRVPCFFHWPAGGLTGGRDVDTLAAHIDLLPTLVDLLGLKKPLTDRALDGVSLRPVLLQTKKPMPQRTLFVHVQRSFLPPEWTRSAAMTERWRLIDGAQLYDIIGDPGQKNDVAADNPDVVSRLRADYQAWWTSLEPALRQTVRYGLGGAENPTTLASHDWLMPGVEQAAWHQSHIERGSLINGAWAVDVERSGTYEITLYRWPPYLNRAMDIREARLTIGQVEKKVALETDATHAAFRVTLPNGPAMLQTWLTRPDGKQHGAYYTRVRYVPD